MRTLNRLRCGTSRPDASSARSLSMQAAGPRSDRAGEPDLDGGVVQGSAGQFPDAVFRSVSVCVGSPLSARRWYPVDAAGIAVRNVTAQRARVDPMVRR